MGTPKTLSELRYESFVFTARSRPELEALAKAFAEEILHTDQIPKVRKLFTEMENGEVKEVFEVYADSGSDDYAYIIRSL